MNLFTETLGAPEKMSKNMLFLRGIIMLILGICIFFKPAFTLWWLTILLGALVLFDGVLTMFASLKIKSEVKSIMIADAIFMILLGFFALISPLLMDLIWIMLIGIWEILTGLQSIFMRRESDNLLLSTISGVISVVIGLFFLALPAVGMMTLFWLVGIALIIAAIVCFYSVWKL